MFFSDLPELQPDPVLRTAREFAEDAAPGKVDLGIGIYKDEHGQASILRAVKAAELHLVETQSSKAYLTPAGDPAYTDATASLLFGDAPALREGRVRTLQTPGGTAALRVAAQFLARSRGAAKIHLPDPTWANHTTLFGDAGLTVVQYPYFERSSGTLRFDAMIDTLGKAAPGDIVLLHGCCHNPTGVDLSRAQWTQLSHLLEQRGLLPLIDLAYQGFGDGLEEDAAPLRLLAGMLPELIVASSYSKNFALYRDRAAALSIVVRPGSDADRARGHLIRVVRGLYSMPADHGAAVVRHVLTTPALRSLWSDELASMRNRVLAMRRALVQALAHEGAQGFDAIAAHRGMFSLLDVAPSQVEWLRRQHHVYLDLSGRMNVAGLTRENLAPVAKALARVLGHGEGR